MQAETTIKSRFNGPPGSGNGGYSCGLVAAHIAGVARVRLHIPPPLETPLQVDVKADKRVKLFAGDTLVASGVSATLELEVPSPPSEAEARASMADFPCYQGHAFPTCFVCGPEREPKDGLEIFCGPVAGHANLWASLWQPGQDLCDSENNVREEILWAALDCPGYFASMEGELRPALLGELVAELRGPVPGDKPLVVFAWSLGNEGRKFFGGTAVASEGEVLASALSTWIELKS